MDLSVRTVSYNKFGLTCVQGERSGDLPLVAQGTHSNACVGAKVSTDMRVLLHLFDTVFLWRDRPCGHSASEQSVGTRVCPVALKLALLVERRAGTRVREQADIVSCMQVVNNFAGADARQAAIVVMVNADGGESALLPPCSSLPLPALEFLAATINAMRAAPVPPENETALSTFAELATCADIAMVRSRRSSNASADLSLPNSISAADIASVRFRESQAYELARLHGRGVEALAWLQTLPPFTSHRVAVHQAGGASDLCVDVKFLGPPFLGNPSASAALHGVAWTFLSLAIASSVLDSTASVVLLVLGGGLWGSLLGSLMELLGLACLTPEDAVTTEIRIGFEEWSMRQHAMMPWWALACLTRTRTVSGKTAHLKGCEVRRCLTALRRCTPVQ